MVLLNPLDKPVLKIMDVLFAERVTQRQNLRLEEEERGPVFPSPLWSRWETVTDGLVPSPGVDNTFIQFRVFMSKPGTALRRLVIEYIDPPIAEELAAEIAPTRAVAGAETPFTVSPRANLRTVDPTRTLRQGDTGFQQVEILTDAEVVGIDAVRLDDVPVSFTPEIRPGEGAAVRLWRRVVQDGTFIQVDLRARVFRDATRFTVQAADRRDRERRPRVGEVEHRCDVRPRVVFVEAEFADGSECMRAHVLVGEHHALRRTGGAARVVELRGLLSRSGLRHELARLRVRDGCGCDAVRSSASCKRIHRDELGEQSEDQDRGQRCADQESK